MKKSKLLHGHYAVNSIDGLKPKNKILKGTWLARLLEWFNAVSISTQYRLFYAYHYGK